MGGRFYRFVDSLWCRLGFHTFWPKMRYPGPCYCKSARWSVGSSGDTEREGD